MPIGSGIVYNTGDLILSQVSSSGTAFLETKIAAATSSIIYFDSNGRINSASLNSLTVGTASYVSGSTSIITNLTASNISASGTGSFGIVGIGTTSFAYATTNRGVAEIYGSTDGLLALRNSTGNLYIQKTTTDVYINNESNGFIAISNNGSERWRITSTGILQSNGAQTLQTSTGNLTLATAGGNGHILLSPNGSGNVGIGTSSPAQKLEVQSGSVLLRGDGSALFGIYYASAGENTFFTLHSGSGNTFHIGNDVAGTNYNTIVLTAATDSTGGKVGIGTNSPVAKLQVAGNISGSSFTSSVSNAVGFLGTASWAQNVVTASYLVPTNSYTITNLTASGVVKASQIAEKVVTFTPLSGSITGAPAWYRIISGSGVLDSGRVRMSANYDNSRSDIEFTYAVRNYDTDGAGAFINITRASTYNSLFNAVRVIETGNLAEPYAIDVLIGNYLNNTTPGPVTCLYESQFIGAVLDTPTFVSASATGSNIVKTVYTTYTSGYPRIGPTYSDGLAVATVQGQLSVGYRGNYAYNTPSTLNYALLVSGSVGIGTSSPSYKLDVSGSIRAAEGEIIATGNNAAFRIYRTSGINYFDWASGQSLYLGTVTSEGGAGRSNKMVILDSGYVGIGTSSPGFKLDVYTPGNNYARLNSGASGSVLIINGANSDAEIVWQANSSYRWAMGMNVGDGTENLNIYNYTTATINLHINKTSGFVGIGTTSPGALLDVSYGDYQSAGTIRIGADLGANTSRTNTSRKWGLITGYNYTNASAAIPIIGYDSNNTYTAIHIGGGTSSIPASPTYISFYTTSSLSTYGTERVRIDSSGLVGIGTTNPSYLVDVYKTSNDAVIRSRTTGAGAYVYLDSATDGWYGINMLSGSTSRWFVGSYGTSDFTITRGLGSSEYVRVTTTGNVGIGTTNPVSKLHTYSSGSSQIFNQIQLVNYGTANLGDIVGIGFAAGETTQYGVKGSIGFVRTTNYGRGAITFYTNNTAGTEDVSTSNERMRIAADGNVGIGTTNPSTLLQLKGDAASHQIFSINRSGSATPAVYIGNDSSHNALIASNNTNLRFGKDFTGTFNEYVRIDTSGNVGIGTTSVNNKLDVWGATGTTLNMANVDDSGRGGKLTFISSSVAGRQFYVGTNSSIYNLVFGIDSIEKMRLDTNGNVGIGVTSPSGRLHITGSATSGETLLYLSKGTGSFSQNYINAVDQAGASNYRVTSDINGYSQQTLYRSGTSYVYHDSYWSSWINNANYAQGGFSLGTGSLTHGYALNISRPAVSGSLYVSGSSIFTGSINVNGSITASLFGTSSWANNVVSASYATTAQTANALNTGNSYTIAGLTNNGTLSMGSGYQILATTGTTSIPGIAFVGDTNTGIYSSGADTIGLVTGGSEKVTINSTGYVGIGSSAPTYKLHVNGGPTEVAAQSAATFEKQSSTDGRIALFSNSTGSGYSSYIYIGSNPGRDWKIGKNVLNSGTTGHFQIVNDLNNLKMQINASDDSVTFPSSSVGIGTSNPTDKLTVYGAMASYKTGADTIQTQVYLANAGNTRAFNVQLNSGGTGLDLWSYNSSNAWLRHTTFDYNGSVGIGTATSIIGKLQLDSGVAPYYGPATSSATPNGFLTLGSTSGDVVNTFGVDATSTAYAWIQPRKASAATYYSLVLNPNGGNVGIGTVTPAAKLEITGSSNSALLNIKSPISGAILYVSGSGAVGIGDSNVGTYRLYVSGSFGATTKSFIIDHPTKQGKKLIYGSLESPYHGIRLTGRDTLKDGKCKVELPEYIYKLILHDSVNIQLTGIKCNKTLYVDDINIPENYFTIAYDKALFESYKDYDFFWDFTAIRADVPELITEL